MTFSKRKARRGPLQRLSDQRRSLALAGLAIGAVFSAAILRRRQHGEEVRPDPAVPTAAAQPEPAAPVAPADTGPPPAADVPTPASATEPDDDRPINAAPPPQSATAASARVNGAAAPAPERASQPAASPPVESATGELSLEEASILAILAQSGRGDDDRTAIAVATSLGRETGGVTDVLRKLGAEGVVSGELRTASGEEIWAVTERGVRRLGAQS